MSGLIQIMMLIFNKLKLTLHGKLNFMNYEKAFNILLAIFFHIYMTFVQIKHTLLCLI